MRTLKDIPLSDMEDIMDKYKQAKYFNEENIFSELLSDEDEITLPMLVSKYYEEEDIKERIDLLEKNTRRTIKSMLQWSLQQNSQCQQLYSRIITNFLVVEKLLMVDKVREEYTNYYDPKKENIYKSEIQAILNSAYYTEHHIAKLTNLLGEIMYPHPDTLFTEKVQYDMPKEFDMLRMTESKLKRYLEAHSKFKLFELPQFSTNDEKLMLPTITCIKALEDFPTNELASMIGIAESAKEIRLLHEYTYVHRTR